MNNVQVNNELNLTYPDGFKEMGEAELIKYFGKPDNRWGAYHADDHIILSVGWKKAGLSSNTEGVLFELESRMKRNLLNYQQIHAFQTKVASKKAHGVRFEYRVNDARLNQVCDLIVFKSKKVFYSVWFITRKFNAAESRRAFEEVLNSITLG